MQKMLDIIFGWRKASKCKKLIKRVQCRLKLLKNKRFTISRQLKEDIAQLLKNGYEQIAFNRLDQLYVDENMIVVYELLHQLSEFIIINLSYIRRHKDLPNDVNEAVSTLIFASARCGDLPELRRVRKLFRERYGQKLTISAVELHPGNLVNLQVKKILIPQSIPEDEKNRLLDEILRDFFKSGMLALEYKPDFHAQSQKVINELYEIQEMENNSASTNCSIVLQSSPSIIETPKQTQVVQTIAKLSTPYEYEADAVVVRKTDLRDEVGSSSESSIRYSEDSVIYLDDVYEFQSPTKQGKHCIEQDQRFFMFSFPSLCDNVLSFSDTRGRGGKNLASKRMMRSVSSEKQTIEDLQCDIYYSYNKSNNGNKYQKKVQFEKTERLYLLDQGSKKQKSGNCASRSRSSLHQPCYTNTNDDEDFEAVLWDEKQGSGDLIQYHVREEEIGKMELSALPREPTRDYMDSPLVSTCRTLALAPYVRVATIPQRKEMEMKTTEISRSLSLPGVEINGSRKSASPRHVHPKLPDYEEIEAKFRAIKKAHQQKKGTRS